MQPSTLVLEGREVPLPQLSVAEIFGPTVQGEGPNVGKPCLFLRLGGCNLYCSWCDTPYTWDWSVRNGQKYDPRVELKRMNLPDVMNSLFALDPFQTIKHLVITGGEPLLQRVHLHKLIEHLGGLGWTFEIETNGTQPPGMFVDLDDKIRFNVSPKLTNSGVTSPDRYVRDSLMQFVELFPTTAVFKFVVQEERDLEEVQYLQRTLAIPANRIYVMPEGKTRDDIDGHIEKFAAEAIRLRYNISSRLHVQIWGNRRGV